MAEMRGGYISIVAMVVVAMVVSGSYGSEW